MSIFQILSVLFALFMSYIVSIHTKKKTLTITESSLWYSVWLLFIILAVFPKLLEGIATTLKFTRVFDLLVVAAFMVLSVMSFNNYFAQKKLQDKIERLVRAVSLRNTLKSRNAKKST